MDVEIRAERAEDVDAIRALTAEAFEGKSFSDGTEPAMIDRLRAAEALTLSLVAVQEDEVVGHVAFSPITIDGGASEWFALGPISVRPDLQRLGIGTALILEGLTALRQRGASGCVLTGDPAYYRRFGFLKDGDLSLPGKEAEYFQVLAFDGHAPKGIAAFHPAFGEV